jgi:hypothetical protein
MDDQPPTVGLLTEHDGLYLMNRFFARVCSLTALDGVCQDGRVVEHLEFITRVTTDKGTGQASCSAAHWFHAARYSSNEPNRRPSNRVPRGWTARVPRIM